jgi:hypothetical protein
MYEHWLQEFGTSGRTCMSTFFVVWTYSACIIAIKKQGHAPGLHRVQAKSF